MSPYRSLSLLSLHLGLSLLVLGCGEGGTRVVALFSVPGSTGGPASPSADFYELPFPNDIHTRDGGGIDLTSHPRVNPVVDAFIDAIQAQQSGFSVNAASFFRFSAPIDPASLPASPTASLDPDASVYLVDVDPRSPVRGQRTPVRFQFNTAAGSVIGNNWLSVLPFPGFPLREQTTYAVVITKRLRAAGGGSIGRSSDFDAIAGNGKPSNPALASAKELYRPLWDYLAEPGGDRLTDVVAANVFTTQDATSLLGRVRQVIYSSVALPAPRQIALVSADGGGFAWYDGVYDGPNFQRGQVPYTTEAQGGDIQVDANGAPILQRMEVLRFSFTVPLGATPAGGWPVVLYAHGTGGDYHTFVGDGTAGALASAGIAAVSIDQVLHGPRNPNGDPAASFFNYANPLAARDNTLQGALDNFQLVRLVRDFNFTDAARTVRFDLNRILFFGHSQGGITGVPFVSQEPLIKGAVFSGAGGILYLSLLYKTEPVDVASLVRAVLPDSPLDEFNPILALLQLWIDRADSATYGPLLIDRPPPGNQPKHVFHSLGIVDHFTPVPNIEALATAMRVSPVQPILQDVEGLALTGRPALAPPVTDNLGAVTGVMLEYNAPTGTDGHFVIFAVPAARSQSVEFLRTLADTGTATLVPP
jgi:predicted esterase